MELYADQYYNYNICNIPVALAWVVGDFVAVQTFLHAPELTGIAEQGIWNLVQSSKIVNLE